MDRICIPREEFAERVKKAQRLMCENGIDILFAFANEAEPQFVRYLSDYWPSFETAAVIFAQSGDPVLLIGPESMTYAKDRSKIQDIRRIMCLRESSNPDYPGHRLDTLSEVLENLGCKKIDKFAVAGYNLLPKLVYDEISSTLSSFAGKGEIVRGDDIIMKLRMIKSSSEIACLKKAGEITVKALENVIANIKPGMTEQMVCGYAMQAIYENGGEMEGYPFWALAGEGSNQAISRPRNKIIMPHDYVHLNIGARYEGYAASIARGVFFGKPDEWVLDAMKAAHEAADVIEAELHDLNNSGYIAKRYFDTLAKTGHDKYTLYGPCHATGLMEGEPPWIDTDTDFTIYENMTFCIDMFLGNNDLNLGLRYEDSVRVGKDRGEVYTVYPRKPIFM